MEIREVGDNLLHFAADMGNIRFKGADETHGILFSGTDEKSAASLKQLWTDTNSSERLMLVLALSDESLLLVRKVIPQDKAVILGRAQILSLLESSQPAEELKRHIRSQLPIRRRMEPTASKRGPGFQRFKRSASIGHSGTWRENNTHQSPPGFP